MMDKIRKFIAKILGRYLFFFFCNLSQRNTDIKNPRQYVWNMVSYRIYYLRFGFQLKANMKEPCFWIQKVDRDLGFPKKTDYATSFNLFFFFWQHR